MVRSHGVVHVMKMAWSISFRKLFCHHLSAFFCMPGCDASFNAEICNCDFVYEYGVSNLGCAGVVNTRGDCILRLLSIASSCTQKLGLSVVITIKGLFLVVIAPACSTFTYLGFRVFRVELKSTTNNAT